MSYEPTRWCRWCDGRKYEITFHGAKCDDCHRLYHQIWKQSEHGKAIIKMHNRAAQRDRRAMLLLQAARSRARKKKVPYGVSAEGHSRLQKIIDAGHCELTGLPFNMENRRQLFSWDSPSLDRIMPAKGYVDGNLRVVLYGINAAIGSWGEDVLKRMVSAWLAK